MTLVVGRHHLAGRLGLVRPLRFGRSEPLADVPAALREPCALEDRVDRRARRPLHLGILILQAAQDLLRPETPLLPLRDHTLLDRFIGARGGGVWSAGAVMQARLWVLAMPLLPVVNRLPAHAQPLGDLAHTNARSRELHRLDPLIHDRPRS